MSGKKLLILERSNSGLTQNVTADGAIILEGVFTEFGVRNKNNRIYEEGEVLPHINELKEKVNSGKLLGELDHPKDFDISLSKVSHVIESLEYNSDKKQVIGRIRLLNTSKGKEAQSLIKDGIPLHISSRAAGTVDESGKVKIKKFFTYDLVADPGFANAELSRVNESYGFDNDDDLIIYEMDDTKNIEDKKEITMENNSNYVTTEDFQKYTEYLKGVISNIKESTKSDNGEVIERLIKYTEMIAESVNQLSDYTNYVSEHLDKSISFSDYLAENVNQIKKYTSYLAEELDNSISYAEHVAEHVDNNIEYSNYVAEKLDSAISYTEQIAGGLDKSIQYTEYVVENINTAVVEPVNTETDVVEESVKTTNDEIINETVETTESYKKSISEKLDSLIAKAGSSKEISSMHFMKFLSESRKNEFNSLSEEKQNLIVEKMNANPIMSTNQAENIWESAFIEKKRELNFIDDMPEKYHSKWSNLSESRQAQIIAESKFYSLTTPYAINNFWATRDLRPSQFELEKINEGKTAGEHVEPTAQPLVNEAFATELINRVKFNLGRS